MNKLTCYSYTAVTGDTAVVESTRPLFIEPSMSRVMSDRGLYGLHASAAADDHKT